MTPFRNGILGPMSSLILTANRDHLRLITLNRPEKRNPLSIALLQHLHAAMQEAIRDEQVRTIALTGAGAAFSAGLDLNEVREHRDHPEQAKEATNALYDTLSLIYTSPKPVMALVNGFAVAGGAGLMSVCDLVIAAESARIGYPEVRRGLVAAIVMPYLVRQVGERRAKFLLLTGEVFSAQQALEMGLVNEVTPAESLLELGDDWATVMASCPAEALAETKRIYNELLSLGPAESGDRVRQFHTQMKLASQAGRNIDQFLSQ